ncbi:putative DUF305 domain-containing protein [Desulfarculales bacterium]
MTRVVNGLALLSLLALTLFRPVWAMPPSGEPAVDMTMPTSAKSDPVIRGYTEANQHKHRDEYPLIEDADVALALGKNPKVRKLTREIIKAQKRKRESL